MKPFDDPEAESKFRGWYQYWNPMTSDAHPDPDYPGHRYDWRKAFTYYISPRWDSESKDFKLPDFVRREVEPFTDLTPLTQGAPLGRENALWRSDQHVDPTWRAKKGIWRKGGNEI